MVVIGAGVSGLAAAITARDSGASVISVDENFDIGGRGMLSGGRVHLGGGHALQQKLGIHDTPESDAHDTTMSKSNDAFVGGLGIDTGFNCADHRIGD